MSLRDAESRSAASAAEVVDISVFLAERPTRMMSPKQFDADQYRDSCRQYRPMRMNECSQIPASEQTMLDKIEEVTFPLRNLAPAGSITIFLGPIAQLAYNALGSVSQTIINRKVQRALNELSRQVATIGLENIDRDFLNSEEGADLFRKTLEKCMDTSKGEKVALYVRMLLRGAADPEYRSSAEEYVNLLADLTWDEVLVAGAIYRGQRHLDIANGRPEKLEPEVSTAEHLGTELRGLPEWRVDACLKRLERTGLVREAVGSYFGYTGGAYYITAYFHDLMDHLGAADLTDLTDPAPMTA
jgi:hypothetical protein